MTAERITIAAHEVRKYWRDWPQERRDAVRALSGFLADAIEELANAVAESPSGRCGECDRYIALTKRGVLREHVGDICVNGFRQSCAGVGSLPAVSSTGRCSCTRSLTSSSAPAAPCCSGTVRAPTSG